MKKKVVAYVPMKLNNERLPGKNTMNFGDKPLYKHVLDTLKKISVIDEVYVYCSDEHLESEMPIGIKYLKRNANLDMNTTKGNEIWKAFAEDVDADIYILAHATAPFVSEETFKIGISKVMNESYDSSFATKKIQTFCWKGNEPMNFNQHELPRTQDLEKFYIETSGMYVYEKSIIKNHGKRIGSSPYLVEISDIESIDIDELDDFIFAEIVLRGLTYD